MIAERAYSEQNEHGEFRERSGPRAKACPDAKLSVRACFSQKSLKQVQKPYSFSFITFLFSYILVSARRKIAL